MANGENLEPIVNVRNHVEEVLKKSLGNVISLHLLMEEKVASGLPNL